MDSNVDDPQKLASFISWAKDSNNGIGLRGGGLHTGQLVSEDKVELKVCLSNRFPGICNELENSGYSFAPINSI